MMDQSGSSSQKISERPTCGLGRSGALGGLAAVAVLLLGGLAILRGQPSIRTLPGSPAAPVRGVPPAPEPAGLPTSRAPAPRRTADLQPAASAADVAYRWALLLEAERHRAALSQTWGAIVTDRSIQECRETQVTLALLGCDLAERLSREPAGWSGVIDFLTTLDGDSTFQSIMMVLDPVQSAGALSRWAEILQSEPRPAARRKAAWALSFSARPERLDALLAAFEHDPDRDVREAALKAVESQQRLLSSPEAAARIELALERRLPLEEDGTVRFLASSLLPRPEPEPGVWTGRRGSGRRGF
ncbi:MAG TPA: HEAT repeat domain-containing protein [Planctomycetota bacterium]|nr:HEAT repeat domain-containing protein [Planctomycetota bacterium]